MLYAFFCIPCCSDECCDQDALAAHAHARARANGSYRPSQPTSGRTGNSRGEIDSEENATTPETASRNHSRSNSLESLEAPQLAQDQQQAQNSDRDSSSRSNSQSGPYTPIERPPGREFSDFGTLNPENSTQSRTLSDLNRSSHLGSSDPFNQSVSSGDQSNRLSSSQGSSLDSSVGSVRCRADTSLDNTDFHTPKQLPSPPNSRSLSDSYDSDEAQNGLPHVMPKPSAEAEPEFVSSNSM